MTLGDELILTNLPELLKAGVCQLTPLGHAADHSHSLQTPTSNERFFFFFNCKCFKNLCKFLLYGSSGFMAQTTYNEHDSFLERRLVSMVLASVKERPSLQSWWGSHRVTAQLLIPRVVLAELQPFIVYYRCTTQCTCMGLICAVVLSSSWLERLYYFKSQGLYWTSLVSSPSFPSPSLL